jgi:hypothetical protein
MDILSIYRDVVRNCQPDMQNDLNKLQITTDDGPRNLTNNNVKLKDASFDKTEVFFRDLEKELVKKILEFKDGLIFGSIAWLTSDKILDALAKCNYVQIVVQKEDFLRPDVNTPTNVFDWKGHLRKKYNKLLFLGDRYDCRKPICDLSILGDPSVHPVRCLGNHNADKKSAFPRAHNKFIVFCKFTKAPNQKSRERQEIIYDPTAIWTGSFNLTKNASMSFENALYLENKSGENRIINAFLIEHHQIFALSEPLDWTTNWVEPEFRIGT